MDEEPPAPTVPRIHRHRPKKMAPEELRAALLGAVGTDPTDSIKSDNDLNTGQTVALKRGAETAGGEEDEVEEEEVFDLNPPSESEVQEDDNEQYELGPVEKKASKHSVVSMSTKVGKNKRKVRRRILPEAMDDRFPADSSASSSEELEPTQTAEKSRKRKYKERQVSTRVVILSNQSFLVFMSIFITRFTCIGSHLK